MTSNNIGQRLRIDNGAPATIYVGDTEEPWSPSCIIEIVNISADGHPIIFVSESYNVNFFNGSSINYGEHASLAYNNDGSWDMHIFKTLPEPEKDEYVINDDDLNDKVITSEVDFSKHFLVVNDLNTDNQSLTNVIPRVIEDRYSHVRAGDVLVWAPPSTGWVTVSEIPKYAYPYFVDGGDLYFEDLPTDAAQGDTYTVIDSDDPNLTLYMWHNSEYLRFASYQDLGDGTRVKYSDIELFTSFNELPVPGVIGKIWLAQPQTTDTFVNEYCDDGDPITPGAAYGWDGRMYYIQNDSDAVDLSTPNYDAVSLVHFNSDLNYEVDVGEYYNVVRIKQSIVIPQQVNCVGNVNGPVIPPPTLPSIFTVYMVASLSDSSSADWESINATPVLLATPPNVEYDDYSRAFLIATGGVYRLTINAKLSPFNEAPNDSYWPDDELTFGFGLTGQAITYGDSDSYFSRTRTADPGFATNRNAVKYTTALTEVLFKVNDNSYVQVFAFANCYSGYVQSTEIDATFTFTKIIALSDLNPNG